VPALATPAATWLGRGAQLATEGAVAGAGAGGLTGQDPLTGAAIGAVAGPVIGGLTSAIDTLAGRTGGVRPDIAQLAQTATSPPYSVPLNVAKLSTNPTMRIAGSQAANLPWAGGPAAELGGQRAIQRGLIGDMGETGEQFTLGQGGTMQTAAQRIGGGLDTIANRTTIDARPAAPGAPSLYDDLSNIAQQMPRYGLTDKDPRTPAIKAAFQDILSNIGPNGKMSGTAYRSLTSSDSPVDTLASSDGVQAFFGGQIERALTRAFQRSAAPGDAADLSNLLRQYRTMKTVQPLVAESTTGDISMAKLLPRIIQQSNRYDGPNSGIAYTGGGTLGDLGRIAKQFYGSQPESGTAARSAVMTPWSMVANSPFLGANAALQNYLRSQYVTKNLIQSSLPGAVLPNSGRVIPYAMPATVGLLGQ